MFRCIRTYICRPNQLSSHTLSFRSPLSTKFNLFQTNSIMSQEHKAPADFKRLSKAEKKALKQAKKDAKKAKSAQTTGFQQLAERNAPVVKHPDEAQFGDFECIMSKFKTARELANLSTLDASREGESVWIRGRAHNVRGKGKSCFIVVRRGFYTVQATMFASDTIPKEMVKFSHKIPAESIIDIHGKVVKVAEPTNTSQSDIEIQVEKIFVVSAAEAALPFQIEDASKYNPNDVYEEEGEESKEESKEETGADGLILVKQNKRLDNRWIDLRTPTNHAVFRIQSSVCRYFRAYFLDKDFVEIHTPKITPGVSEGGAEVFRLKYFGSDACLAQSPQLYKQMASACSDLYRVFEIGPVFRAENSNTARHMCEFTGLDFEMEIVEHYHEVLKVLGDLFVYIFDKLNEKCQAELKAVNAQFPFEPLKYRKDTLVLDFKDAVDMLNAAGENMGPYDDFSTPQEKLLGKLVREKYDTDFYIVDRYPLAARPFYTMPSPDDPKYTNSYDVFLRGEEITSGAQRIHDVKLLAKRATECDIPLDNITAYLESFKYGTPPHGGAGIGMERVVMLFMGLNNIRKSSMFPRTPKRFSP